MNKFKLNGFLVYIILINIVFLVMRILPTDYSFFQGDLFSTVIFILILGTMAYLFLAGKNDYFILFWLSVHFACPMIRLPFTQIGSLGVLNGIFIPLMLLRTFNFKNKYFMIILAVLSLSIFHLSEVSLRIILSRMFEILAPFVFFYFVIKKCKKPEFIINGAIVIACLSIPLSIYQIIAQPVGGVLVDWRGARIFGSLFWPNSYAIYLLAPILTTYMLLRHKFTKSRMLIFLLLVFVDIFTFSRVGLLSLMVGIIAFELLYAKGKHLLFKRTAIVFTLIIILFIYSYYSPELNPRFTTSSLIERTGIWDSILPFIEGNVVWGNGVGSYTLYQDQVVKSLSPHNYYLYIIFEIGVVGLSIVILFLFFLIKDLTAKIKQKNLIKYSEIGLSLLCALLLASLAGSGFSQVSALNAWVLLGCFLIYDEKSKKDNHEKKGDNE